MGQFNKKLNNKKDSKILKTIILKNRLSEMKLLENYVLEFGKSKNLSNEIIHDITLALEEVIVNIIKYGYDNDQEDEIIIKISIKNKELIIKVEDSGKPFNPLKSPMPEIHKPIEERKIRGLGIYIVRNIMDKLIYKRVNGRNLFIMKKYLNPDNA